MLFFPSLYPLYYFIIVISPVRESASRAHFDSPAALFLKNRFSRTVIKMIKRAITEQTIDFLYSFVAGIILAIPVCKELM